MPASASRSPYFRAVYCLGSTGGASSECGAVQDRPGGAGVKRLIAGVESLSEAGFTLLPVNLDLGVPVTYQPERRGEEEQRTSGEPAELDPLEGPVAAVGLVAGDWV